LTYLVSKSLNSLTGRKEYISLPAWSLKVTIYSGKYGRKCIIKSKVFMVVKFYPVYAM